MNMKKTAVSAFLLMGLLIFGGAGAEAQEFGFPAADALSGQAAPGAKTGGSLSFTLLAFPAELADSDFTDSAALPEARFTVSAAGAKADGFLGLKLDKNLLDNDPASVLDEAWLRIYAGPATMIQAGLMRLSWGRADSLSVLDILNPRDLSDLTLRDESDRKIAVPMLRLTQGLGDRVSADIVYLPWFEGDRIARTGPWTPARLDPFAPATIITPDMSGLDSGQAGLRLTTSPGGIDLGAQYFYGYMTTPWMDTMDAAIFLMGNPAQPIGIGYNPYHQLGADLAFVAAGFNVRAEAAINLTNDDDGTATLVYNRNIAWSVGFDRSIFAGINLNVQAMGKLRLNHDKIVSPLDIESGTDVTSTQVAAILSRGLAQDRVKLELLGMMGVEKQDYMIEPGIVLIFGDAEIALRGRYFGGDATGDLGQYNDKSYVSISSKYHF